MFGECHAHIFMNGINYREACSYHQDQVQDAIIHKHLAEYPKYGIFYIRDGGDHLGVSLRARDLAPDHGLEYRTPVFAIHKKGHYGKIVGKGFSNIQEYAGLVKEVREKQGDFIKIMVSGIMDFSTGGLSEDPLPGEEIREMIHIAREEGFAVMAHCNGASAIIAAAEAGVSSIEHGNFQNEESLQAIRESGCFWVPTLVTISNLQGKGRFPAMIVDGLLEKQRRSIQRGWEMGCRIALGSDAGAWQVFHGKGLQDEYQQFQKLFPREHQEGSLEKKLMQNEIDLKRTFTFPCH